MSLSLTFTFSDTAQAEYKPYEIELLNGDKWEYRYTLSNAGMDMVITAYSEVIGENTIEIDGTNYDVYVLQVSGTIESVEMDTSSSGVNFSFVDDYSSHTGTIYLSKISSTSKQILNMRFKLLEDLTDKTLDYDITSTIINKEIFGGKPEFINVGSSWVSTIASEETQTMTMSGAFFDFFYGEGYTNTTTGKTNTTVTKNYECLSEESTSVTAGPFDTYKIRSGAVGDASYSLEYFSTDVKNKVKIVSYDDEGTMTSLTELLSYDLTSGTSDGESKSGKDNGTPGFELIIFVSSIAIFILFKRKKLS